MFVDEVVHHYQRLAAWTTPSVADVVDQILGRVGDARRGRGPPAPRRERARSSCAGHSVPSRSRARRLVRSSRGRSRTSGCSSASRSCTPPRTSRSASPIPASSSPRRRASGSLLRGASPSRTRLPASAPRSPRRWPASRCPPPTSAPTARSRSRQSCSTRSQSLDAGWLAECYDHGGGRRTSALARRVAVASPSSIEEDPMPEDAPSLCGVRATRTATSTRQRRANPTLATELGVPGNDASVALVRRAALGATTRSFTADALATLRSLEPIDDVDRIATRGDGGAARRARRARAQRRAGADVRDDLLAGL